MIVEFLAPAKLNLGLEILGRRDDGFHEIRSVMTPVTLVDRLVIASGGRGRLATGGLPVEVSGNLVCSAIALAGSAGSVVGVDATLTKRIPLSSGLGGGSSDAAAALLGMRRLTGRAVDSLHGLAAQLGSDVAFFLDGGSALVAGRGEYVTPTPAHVPLHAVIVAPNMTIPRKTASMYASLTPDDFSDGASVVETASDLGALCESETRLPNAFRRALYALVPDLSLLAREIEAATSLPAHLTGAGPAHYVVCKGPEHASSTARRLRDSLTGRDVAIYAVRSMRGINMREVASAG